jgi:uncharacterized protein YbjT (DUF2867 family)
VDSHVTGTTFPIQATASVGRPIVDALVADGFTVTVGTRRPRNNNHGSKTNFLAPASIKTANLEYVSSLAAAFAGQDAVVEAFNHAAAQFQVTL